MAYVEEIDPMIGVRGGVEHDPGAPPGTALRTRGGATARRHTRWSAVLVSAAMLVASGGQARGPAVADLTTIGRAVMEALGPGFVGRAEPSRIDMMCSGRAGEPIVGVQIGARNDGTEQRVRSGRTTITDPERICRARSPECRMSALDVAPAVGWVSSYRIGRNAGATAVVIRDGELFTIRSVATDAASARRNVDKLVPLVRRQLIGR